MIIEDMRNTGVLGTPEEWFVPWSPEKIDIDWKDALNGVEKRATGSNGVMAIKVMANQLVKVEKCLGTFMHGAVDEGGEFPNFARTFEDAIWVKLTRRDVIGQSISRVMSRQTGINHATAKADDDHFAGNLQAGYKTDYNEATVYRYGLVLREATSIVLENLAWERFFQRNNLQYTELFYEEVAKDGDMGHLDIIAQLAGIDEPLEKQPRKLVKLANDKNKTWKDRFYRDAALNDFQSRRP